jgi:hypothetical protein
VSNMIDFDQSYSMQEKKANMKVCLIGKAVKIAKVKASINRNSSMQKERNLRVLDQKSSLWNVPCYSCLSQLWSGKHDLDPVVGMWYACGRTLVSQTSVK